MRQIRKLEDLNLVDNFLVNSLTSHQVYGELFDLEPDNNDGKKDVAALPRRTRFYHAKLGTTWNIRQRKMQRLRTYRDCMRW